MTVLVTGGAGYIGSHTVRLLRERGRDVVVLDSLELGHRAAVLDAPLVVGRHRRRTARRESRRRARRRRRSSTSPRTRAPASRCTSPRSTSATTSVARSVCSRRCDGRVCVASSSRRRAATYGTPETLPVPEGHALAPGEPVRREQADGRAHPALVRHGPRPAFRQPALLQRGRRLSATRAIGEDWTDHHST